MNATQTAQEFVLSYFTEKEAMRKLQRQTHTSLAENFFAREPAKVIVDIWNPPHLKETLVTAKTSGDQLKIVTTVVFHGRETLHRYLARLLDGEWRIYRAETQCNHCCKGTGQFRGNCLVCKETGWSGHSAWVVL